jgi:hypothetical protein
VFPAQSVQSSRRGPTEGSLKLSLASLPVVVPPCSVGCSAEATLDWGPDLTPNFLLLMLQWLATQLCKLPTCSQSIVLTSGVNSVCETKLDSRQQCQHFPHKHYSPPKQLPGLVCLPQPSFGVLNEDVCPFTEPHQSPARGAECLARGGGALPCPRRGGCQALRPSGCLGARDCLSARGSCPALRSPPRPDLP